MPLNRFNLGDEEFQEPLKPDKAVCGQYCYKDTSTFLILTSDKVQPDNIANLLLLFVEDNTKGYPQAFHEVGLVINKGMRSTIFTMLNKLP